MAISLRPGKTFAEMVLRQEERLDTSAARASPAADAIRARAEKEGECMILAKLTHLLVTVAVHILTMLWLCSSLQAPLYLRKGIRIHHKVTSALSLPLGTCMPSAHVRESLVCS